MSLISKISRFARSPEGRRLAGQAAKLARDPKTRRRIDDVRRRFADRSRAPGSGQAGR
jgi:hypothetical protein